MAVDEKPWQASQDDPAPSGAAETCPGEQSSRRWPCWPPLAEVGCSSLWGRLPRRAAPVAKLEDFVIRFVTQTRPRIRGDPNIAYRTAEPRYSDYATIAEQIIHKPVNG